MTTIKLAYRGSHASSHELNTVIHNDENSNNPVKHILSCMKYFDVALGHENAVFKTYLNNPEALNALGIFDIINKRIKSKEIIVDTVNNNRGIQTTNRDEMFNYEYVVYSDTLRVVDGSLSVRGAVMTCACTEGESTEIFILTLDHSNSNGIVAELHE